MITVFRGNHIYQLSELKEILKRQIEILPRMISSVGNIQQLLRFEFDCEGVNLLAWLHNQDVSQKIYWSDRKDSFEVAGVEAADIIAGSGPFTYKEVFETIEDKLSRDSKSLRYYGGFCFDVNDLNSDWKQFGSYRFIVPRFEIVRRKEKYLFAFNIDINDIDEGKIADILLSLDKIDFSDQTKYRSVPKILGRNDLPSEEEWISFFNAARTGSYKKIVLARQSDFNFDVNIRPCALIKFLKDQSPNCYHFCIQTGESHGFLGATPERLLRIDQTTIHTEAVAGTTPRGESSHQTKQFQEELLYSDKLNREHTYVVDHINDKLSELCSYFQKDDKPDLLKLKNGQHLITRFEGHLKYEVHMDQAVQALHPTPAVAGFPEDHVLDSIRELEPFSRGWYAGPVGYVGFDHCEFAVAIRSGFVRDDQLSLYAGAGIVEGSTAKDEWNEIENKISRFMKVFE